MATCRRVAPTIRIARASTWTAASHDRRASSSLAMRPEGRACSSGRAAATARRRARTSVEAARAGSYSPARRRDAVDAGPSSELRGRAARLRRPQASAASGDRGGASSQSSTVADDRASRRWIGRRSRRADARSCAPECRDRRRLRLPRSSTDRQPQLGARDPDGAQPRPCPHRRRLRARDRIHPAPVDAAGEPDQPTPRSGSRPPMRSRTAIAVPRHARAPSDPVATAALSPLRAICDRAPS